MAKRYVRFKRVSGAARRDGSAAAVRGAEEGQKALLEKLIGSMRASDTFNVMLFSGSNRMLAPESVPATPANIERALRTIREMGGSGSTEIVPALRRIAALPKVADVSRSVIVITDGYVDVESEVFQLVRKNLNQSNVFAFGIGTAVNRQLIEGITALRSRRVVGRILDLYDLEHNTADGLHIASLAGSWIALVAGL